MFFQSQHVRKSLIVVAAVSMGLAACSEAEDDSSPGTSEAEIATTTTAEQGDPPTERDPEREESTDPDPEREESTDPDPEREESTDPDPDPDPEQDESASDNIGAISVEDASCNYLDDELEATERLNNWRIARDEFLGIPHETTTDERLEQRTLVEIAGDFGYTEETLVQAAEALHTECNNRLVEAGDLTQQQADERVARSVESFASLMNSVPDDEGRGAGTRGQGDSEETDEGDGERPADQGEGNRGDDEATD